MDKQGQTIDFLLTEERDEQAAKRFLTKAIRRHGVPEKITIDGSAANEAAINSYNAEHGTTLAPDAGHQCDHVSAAERPQSVT